MKVKQKKLKYEMSAGGQLSFGIVEGYSAGGRIVRRRSSGFLMGGLAESVVSRELNTGLD
jgi:hypothetical protein